MSKSEPRAGGPLSFNDIIAEAVRVQARGMIASETTPSQTLAEKTETIVEVTGRRLGRGEEEGPEWLLHETEMLRRPVYRTERGDSDDDPAGSYFDQPTAGQLPLLTYEYDPE